MLPHNHFLIAGLAITPVALYLSPERPGSEIVEWVLVGGFASACIDLDILTLVLLKSRENERLRVFRNPIEIFRRFAHFMDVIVETGVLRIGLKTHLVMSAFIMAACVLAAPAYIVPVAIGVLSHILSDLQYIRRLRA